MKTAILDIAALKAAAFAASTEETRYYLNGVLVEITARGVTYVATDGHILFAHKAELEPGQNDNTLTGHCIIPAATIKALKLPKKNQIPVATLEGEGLERFSELLIKLADGTSFGFKPIDGCFPNWRRVLPVKTSGKTSHGYNPNLLLKLWKAGEALGSDKPAISYNDDAPALLTYAGEPNTVGVIMPMRQGKTATELPAWIAGAGESVSLAA